LKLVEEGKAGKKAGEGFYINDEDKRGMERWKLEPDKELKRLLNIFSPYSLKSVEARILRVRDDI